MKLNPEDLAIHAHGELSALMIAVHAMLILHPRRDEVAAKIHEGIEEILSRTEPKAFPQPFLDGIYQIRDRLLKAPEDPGQPRAT